MSEDELIEFTDPKTELQNTILAAIIAAADDADLVAERMSYVLPRVQDAFMEGDNFSIWRILTRYYPLTGAVPTAKAFDEILESSIKLTPSDKLRLSTNYTALAGIETSQTQYKLACVRLQERWRDEQYGELLAKAQRILLTQYTEGTSTLSGFDDSVGSLRDNLSKLEQLVSMEAQQEGDINIEMGGFLQTYAAAKEGKIAGILTGFTELDDLTRGMQPGELWLVAGFTGEGKSKVTYNVAYAAAYLQGKNVLFGTNEATREQVRRNIICRHSRHAKFKTARGLKYSDLKFGTLSKEDEEILRAVLNDLKTGDYGRMFTFQLPYRATPDYLSGLLHRQQRMGGVDVLIVDYLELMAGSVKRNSRREELDDLLVATKRLAVEFGVPVLSPWQVSRDAWKEAQKTGYYTKAALSDTSQAEKATDLILSLLRPDDAPDTLKCQVLKFRDGETGVQFTLAVDFGTAYVTSQMQHRSLLEQLE